MTERFETFTVLINRISRKIRKIKIQEMADYNLRSAHVSCLYYLYTNRAPPPPICASGVRRTRPPSPVHWTIWKKMVLSPARPKPQSAIKLPCF